VLIYIHKELILDDVQQHYVTKWLLHAISRRLSTARRLRIMACERCTIAMKSRLDIPVPISYLRQWAINRSGKLRRCKANEATPGAAAQAGHMAKMQPCIWPG